MTGIADMKVSLHGTYKLTLGLTREGYFHEIVAQGASKITARILEYDLDEIKQEGQGLRPRA